MVTHKAQLKILRQLLFRPKARFTDLNKATGLDGDHFNFHLNKLQEVGLIEKTEKYYQLTPSGLEYAGRIDTTSKKITVQPKVSVMVFVKRVKSGRKEILLSERRYEAFRTIYEIATQLEVMSLDAGYSLSRCLAAGSCKSVFCMDYECQALIDGTSCRYDSLARPSMSALGINVFKLIEDVGWEIYPLTRESDPA